MAQHGDKQMTSLVCEYQFEVWTDSPDGWGEYCAGGGGMDVEQVVAEANHYALIYGQDGPVTVKWFERYERSEPPTVAPPNFQSLT
jgi:hypothetical protein